MPKNELQDTGGSVKSKKEEAYKERLSTVYRNGSGLANDSIGSADFL